MSAESWEHRGGHRSHAAEPTAGGAQMRLRDHYIRKTRRGWLVQPVDLRDGQKPSEIVEPFAEAAAIALPQTTCTVHVVGQAHDAALAIAPGGSVTRLPAVLP